MDKLFALYHLLRFKGIKDTYIIMFTMKSKKVNIFIVSIIIFHIMISVRYNTIIFIYK